MTDDLTLLRQYTSQSRGSRDAVDELIRRHLNLVYSSALRQVRDPHLAEDITQAVFLILAQKAKSIRDGVAVAGWLLAVTRTTAVDVMRKRTTNRQHELALAKPESAPPQMEEWNQIAPVLDAALNDLPHRDRDAITLRVLENQPLAHIGAALGITEEAAKKRVSRALSTLRTFLARRGISSSAEALSATIGIHAVHAAPAHLLTATLAGTSSASAILIAKSSLHIMAWAKAKIAAALILIALLATTSSAMIVNRAFNPHAPTSPPPAAPVAVLPAGDSAPPESILPSIFATDDWFTGSNFDVSRAGSAADPIVSSVGGNRLLELRAGSTTAQRLISDAAGNLYSAGQTWDDAGQLHGIVREKRRTDSQWHTILDVGLNGVGTIGGLAVSPTGGLYAGGYSSRAGGWYVYYRAAGQQAFLADPVDRIASDQPGYIAGIALDEADNVYLVGEMAEHWIVRKRAHGVGEFVQVDDFTADPSQMGEGDRTVMPQDISVVHGSGPSAGIYICGRYSKITNNAIQHHWTVRRSRDEGRTWLTVDDFRVDPSQDFWRANMSSAIGADAQGAVYVTGAAGASDAHVSDGPNRWTTRRSATGDPGTWAVDDDFVLAADFPYAVGQAIAGDRWGNVYVAGVAAGDAGGGCHAIIRTNAGGFWHTLDDFTSLQNRAGWNALAVDTEGRLWAAGWVQGSNPGWIVRSALPEKQTTITKTSPSVPVKTDFGLP